jgi:thioredoxin 1
MSDGDELEQLREQKRKELIERQQSSAVETETGDGAPDTPIRITGQDHFEEVTSSYDVVLVDCYADWCGPCQMMEPTIEALAAESDATVAKVDIDSNQVLTQQLGVQGVPTLVVFSDGTPVERVVGAQDRNSLERLIQQAS